jgi:hypothetical protein
MNIKLLTINLLLLLILSSRASFSQTVVTGDVSGTWNNAGSPYLLIEDCTVQTGDSLIIEPGVEIGFSDSVSLHVYGKILANGTPESNIIFKTINDTVKYKYVHVMNGSSLPPISEFSYCKFMNAQKGLSIHAYGRIDNAYTTLNAKVSNCSFDSTVTTGIKIRSQAVDASQYMTPRRRNAMVSPIINGCTFSGNEVGIEMDIQGAGSAYYSTGNTDAMIQNNLFIDVSGSAISMLQKSLNAGTPGIINNTLINCQRGIWIQDEDFDATIINNIFYSIDTVVERTGSNSSVVFYNCFYNNNQNFAGYPKSFGDVIMKNKNNDSCDIGQNIFLDPSFLNPNSYILSYTSPCLNAGKDSIENNEVWYYSPLTDIEGNSRPKPLGSNVDIGAYEMKNPCNITDLDKTICPGDSINLGEKWFTEGGSYIVVLKDIQDCDSIINLHLTVNPLPEVNLGNDTTIVEGTEINLDAGEGFESYFWNTQNTSQSLLVSGLNAGEHKYSVLVTDENECSNSDSIVITVIIPDAITNTLENTSISIYPNPTTDVAYFQTNQEIGSRFTIAVYNANGKLVMNKELENIYPGHCYKIDISMLTAGMYILKLNDKESVKIQKLIKE